MERRKINTTLVLAIDIILLILSVFVYNYIFDVESLKKNYSEETTRFIESNENPVFKVGQIVLYSSANAIDNSNGDLKDIDISQFTDMEIYIDNKVKEKNITAENTINEMFISNIKIESKSKDGEKIFNYKNPQNCGKYVDLSNWEADGILFNITRTNEENKNANYDHNIFYTDCSNPISVGYINKNILKGCQVSKELGTVAFDGTILKSAGIDVKELETKISFSINITNNYNEKFVCNLSLDIDLDSEEEGIYSGYLIKMLNPEGDKYNFIKVQ